MTEANLTRRRWEQRLLIFGMCNLIGAIFSIQIHHMYNQRGETVSWSDVILGQVPLWWLLALSFPFIAWLARRFPFTRQRWLRSCLIHLTAAFAFSILHSIVYAFVVYLIDPKSLENFLSSWKHFYLHLSNLNLALRILGYFLLLTISLALDYYYRYEEGVLRASQLTAQLAQAQLRALKMQLHPHFLFNTLHSISALLRKDAEAADRMIARLGDFLRLTLENGGDHKVRLQRELEFLRCYLEIEEIRFQDRMTFRMDCDPQAMDALVPNLIWQPIVENAIRYAIAPRTDQGHIEMSARKLDGKIRLQVKDDGPGIPTEKKDQKPVSGGFGLANTRERLRQIYGENHWFSLSNGLESGLIVTLEIPFELAEEPMGYNSQFSLSR